MEKKRTWMLRNQVLVTLILIILLQSVILTGVVYLSQTPQKLDQSAEAVFTNSVSTGAIAIEKRLTDMSDLNNYETNIYQEINRLAEKKNLTVSEYLAQSSSNKQLLNQVFEHVLECLREMSVTDAFIILENPESDTKKDALILRDLTPDSVSVNNHDVLVEAGSSDLMFEQGLTLDALWTEKLNLSEDAEFYYKPFQAGNAYANIEAEDLGYYSRPHRLHEHDIQLISYTRPLLDENHQVCGVIGVSYSVDYLQALLEERSIGIGIDGDSSFFIGITENDKEFESIVAQAGKYEGQFHEGGVFSLEDEMEVELEGNNAIIKHVTTKGNEQFDMMIYHCRLYLSNTPFSQEKWVIGGLTDYTVLHQGSASLQRALIIAISISILICIISAVLISEMMARPIRLLLKGIGKFGRTAELDLPRTGIREFDQLAEEIEHREQEVYRAGAKVSDIIHMTDIQLGVLEYEKYSEYAFCNDRLLEMFEVSIADWKENYAPCDAVRDCMRKIRQRLEKDEEEENIYCFKTKAGDIRWVSIKEISDSQSQLCVFLDVTESVREKQKIRHDRDYDVLTSLYNRRAFARIVRRMLEEGGCSAGVLSVWDLDHLKYINDTYGHDMGDQYIQLLAQVITACPVNNYVAARMSGDEFMVFFYDDTLENMYQYARDLHSRFQGMKLQLPDGKDISVSVSAGMAAYDKDGSLYTQLVRYADFAMYQVKKSNKGNIKAFDRQSYIQDYVLVNGVGELNRILEEKSIRYAFQPIVDVRTKQVFAYEALLRPISDMIKSPAELLQVAEKQSKLGVIEKLTWFLAMESFFKAQSPDGETKLFINSIPNQSPSQQDLEILEERYGKHFHRLVVEVTENVRMDNQIETLKYNWCNARGVAMALDDFGTGYSNTDILISRKFKFVKLDMSLIQRISQSPDQQNLVSGIIAYCHGNGQKVISEGIENHEDLMTMVRLGTDYVQGYYLGKPEYTVRGSSYESLF